MLQKFKKDFGKKLGKFFCSERFQFIYQKMKSLKIDHWQLGYNYLDASYEKETLVLLQSCTHENLRQYIYSGET